MITLFAIQNNKTKSYITRSKHDRWLKLYETDDAKYAKLYTTAASAKCALSQMSLKYSDYTIVCFVANQETKEQALQRLTMHRT